MNRSIVRGCLQIGAAMESAEEQEHAMMARTERLPKKMGLLELLGAESGIRATIDAERNYRDKTVVAYAQLDAYLATRVNDFPMRVFRLNSDASELAQYRIELMQYRTETEREIVRLIRELNIPDYGEATREFNKVEDKIRSTIVSIFKEPGSAAFGAPGAILGSFIGRMVYQQSKMDGVDFAALISRFRSEELASFVGDIAEEAAGLVGLGNTKDQAKNIFGAITKLIPRSWRRAVFRGLVALLEEGKDALKARIGGAANEQAEKAINTLFDAWKDEANSAS